MSLGQNFTGTGAKIDSEGPVVTIVGPVEVVKGNKRRAFSAMTLRLQNGAPVLALAEPIL